MAGGGNDLVKGGEFVGEFKGFFGSLVSRVTVDVDYLEVFEGLFSEIVEKARQIFFFIESGNDDRKV